MNDNYVEFPRPKVVFLAASVGIIVASMFYIQPIEELLTTSFRVAPSAVAVIAMLTQASHAVGLLLVVPLGDAYNRYRFLQLMEGLSVLSLLLAACAPNAVVFGIAAVAIGLTSVGGQIIIPYVAYLTPVKKQGPILGTMISGMLTGILFARTFSGVIAARWGWQAVYFLAAALNLVLLVLIHYWVPDDPRRLNSHFSYPQLLQTLPRLIREYPYLRGAAVNGFCMFGIANLFWATLSFLLADRFGYGSAVAGSMGLLGVVAIIAAPTIGRLVDRYSPRDNIKCSWWLGVGAYVIFGVFTGNLWLLMLGIVVLDLSTQFSQVTNQAIIQSLSRKTNSRNNSIFMFSYFLGGALGTVIGINAWASFRWWGVTVAAAVFLLIAVLNYYWQGVPRQLGRHVHKG